MSALVRRPLPFSAEDTRQLLSRGVLDYIEVPERYPNSSSFYLQDVERAPSLTWPPELPSCDPRGNPSAAVFKSWKKATDSRMGIAGNYFSWKGHGMVPCHSLLERRHLSYLEMNPNVLEIRAQYPEWDRRKYLLKKSTGSRMSKRDIMTIDFVVTLRIPGKPGLHYHGISIKPYKELFTPAVIRRHEREATALALWGCTHEVMTEFSVSRLEAANNDRLFSYMNRVTHIEDHMESARRIAASVLSQPFGPTCDQIIRRVSNTLGLDSHASYRCFAIANFLGYLNLDHRYPLIPHKQLHLL